jgi:hypothetical protein
MFDQPLYGYEGEVTMKYEQFVERIAELTPQIEEAGKAYQASVVNIMQALRVFEQNGSVENEGQLFEMVGRQRELGDRLGKLDGARQECEKYKKKADTMREASGGEFLFSRQEFESSAASLQAEVKKADIEFVSAGTTLDHIHQNLKRAAKDSPKHANLIRVYEQQLKIYLAAANKVAVFSGAAGENFRIMAWLDKHIRAAGGVKSEEALLEMRREPMVQAAQA